MGSILCVIMVINDVSVNDGVCMWVRVCFVYGGGGDVCIIIMCDTGMVNHDFELQLIKTQNKNHFIKTRAIHDYNIMIIFLDSFILTEA